MARLGHIQGARRGLSIHNQVSTAVNVWQACCRRLAGHLHCIEKENDMVMIFLIYIYFCIKSAPHAFNRHKPCINKAIQVLLMHGFDTLKYTHSGPLHFHGSQSVYQSVIWLGPGKRI